MQENLELFHASADTDIWKAYVDYVDEMVVDGFFSTIHCSLQFLLGQHGATHRPPCRCSRRRWSCRAPTCSSNPSLDYGVADGFYDLIDGLVGDIYKQASQINRLAAHSGQEHYQVRTSTHCAANPKIKSIYRVNFTTVQGTHGH